MNSTDGLWTGDCGMKALMSKFCKDEYFTVFSGLARHAIGSLQQRATNKLR